MTTAEQLRDNILTLLAEAVGVNVFDGDVGYDPATGTDRVPLDSDGRAHPYVVLWPTAPAPDESVRPLYGPTDLATYTAQLTCGGGDTARCLRAFDRVRAVLADQPPAPGWTGLLLTPVGTARADTDTTPPRTFLPVMLTATGPH